MHSSKQVFLLCSLLLMLQACCVCDQTMPGRGRAKVGSVYPEPPFDVTGMPPGPGLVFGTADFSSSGTVLIKIQVEDLSTINGTEATIRAWSGNGEAPSGTGAPTVGSLLYSTPGDVPLRDWTSHIARNYDSDASTRYWVFVEVDHNTGSGTRQLEYMKYTWDPAATSSPDSLHEFNS